MITIKPIRRPTHERQPEYSGRPLTSTQPLDNDERLSLFRVKRAINEFFKPECCEAVEEHE